MAKTRRRKKRTHVETDAAEAKKPDPKTFVFKRGKHGAILADLEQDMRRMLLPNTALNLRESRKNSLRDFVSVAGPLGVTHFVMLSATDNSSYIKFAKTPRGPTMTMRVRNYSLIRDVQSAAVRPRVPANAFKTPPLVVMNGFSGNDTLRLVTTLFQGVFPPINVQRTKLSACQRVVLLSRDKESGLIRLRHYGISVAPSGLRKSVKGLLSRREVPDLSAFRDVSEFVTKSGYGSVQCVMVWWSGGLVEEGLCEGAVLFHAHDANVRRKAAEAARKAAAQADEMRQQGKLPAGQKQCTPPATVSVTPAGGEDFYLCVNVKEALDLEPGVSLMGATCDPFVRVVLARPGSLPLAEAETRVILRNSHPLWEEWLPFSLDNVTEDMLVALRVMDKDIGHFISFCGMVSLPIKEVLSTITDMGEEVVYRMPLMDKSGTTRRPGVLVFGISILAKDQYDEMRKVITAIQDPDQIHAQLHEYQLHIKVHGVKGLAALGSGSAAASAGLALQFSTVRSFLGAFACNVASAMAAVAGGSGTQVLDKGAAGVSGPQKPELEVSMQLVRVAVLVKGDGGWVVENRITPNVPPVVGQHVGAGKTRLTVSLRTEWFKSGMMVNVVKGKVESATPPDAVKFFNTLKTELAAKYAGAQREGV
eukprot:XP_001698510.1 predicted protein [Chlamydomonas reinhardtii]